jgi:hypothetical protein
MWREQYRASLRHPPAVFCGLRNVVWAQKCDHIPVHTHINFSTQRQGTVRHVRTVGSYQHTNDAHSALHKQTPPSLDCTGRTTVTKKYKPDGPQQHDQPIPQCPQHTWRKRSDRPCWSCWERDLQLQSETQTTPSQLAQRSCRHPTPRTQTFSGCHRSAQVSGCLQRRALGQTRNWPFRHRYQSNARLHRRLQTHSTSCWSASRFESC